nr:carboxymuconolactone decarboxylase family protein [uncultured Tolumonas sp.]
MNLTPKEQHLAIISATTAMGNIDALKTHLNAALNVGVCVNELKELLIQLYAYCGFPRSLNGLAALMLTLDNRKASGIDDAKGEDPRAIPTDKSRFELGDMVQRELTGGPVQGPLFTFAPAIDAFLKEHLFADIFLRGVLNYQEREIITIAALASLGVVSQLTSHIKIGMNTGLTRAQISSMADLLLDSDQPQASELINGVLANMPA